MPATLSELFNGGIVTARHPALLQPGELQQAADCVYREKDPAIWRAPGRNKMNAVALGSVWAGAAAGVKGLAHLTFERTRQDQLLAYNGTVMAKAALTASAAGVIDPIDLQLSATTDGTTALTSAALFGSVLPGWSVTGTNIAPGTTVFEVTDASNIVLSRKATGSGTQTLTFNPMLELGGPASIEGTVSGTTTFTATTGYPFLADVIGMQVYQYTNQAIRVINVSGQDGTTGHYNVVELSAALSNGAATLVFQGGCVQTFENNGTTDEIIDLAQYGGSYFVWSGRGPLQRVAWRQRGSVTYNTEDVALDDALLTRPCGLLPVVEQPTVAQTADASYAWPATLPPGYYWFLVTEIFDPDNDESTEIESAYYGKKQDSNHAGEPVPVNIPAATGYGATVTFPTRINNGGDGRISTHWGVYMYGPTSDNTTKPSLAAFRRVAKVRMTASSGQTYVLFENRFIQTSAPTAVTTNGTVPSMTTPTGILTRGGDYAAAKSGSSTDGAEQSAPAEVVATTFSSFSTGAPWDTRSIIGIRVTVRGAADPSGNAGRSAGYYVTIRSGSKVSPLILSEFGSKDMHDNFHGGEMDTMGVAWVTADLTAIQVVVGKTGTGSRQRLRIDYVQLDVYYSSAALNLNGKPFRVVTYRDQIGSTVSEPAAGLPPEANTGDLFQGSLVLNDLSDETAIRFSLPGEPESFPKPYVMRFNSTKRKDRVTLVRTLGQILLVGMQNGIKRVNYLPSEEDTSFQSGLAHDDVATDHGIPGPLAAVKFDWPGRGTVMAYASQAGVFMTDGITTKPLNNDLDWPNTVKLSALGSCVFRVYPKEKWLVLFYCPAGATHSRNTKALIFHYSADHVKNGDELPCTGPLTVSGRASTEAVLNGNIFLLTGHETNGFIYQEDYGVAQASGYQVHNASDSLANAPIVPFIRMRRMYPAGITHDSHLYKVYLLFSAYGSTALTAVADTITQGSTTVAGTGAFASVVAGMRVTGAGIDAGTIVKEVVSNDELTLSRAANTSGTAITLTFDTGTVSATDRGASIGEGASGMSIIYGSTTTGDMLVMHLDDTRQGLELQIEKVPLTFTTHSDGYRFDSATWSDLSVNMRLHQAMILFDDQGPEQTRSAA